LLTGKPAVFDYQLPARGFATIEKREVRLLAVSPTEILMVIRDTTDQQEMLANTMKRDRMAAIGSLAGGIGHEINNPLTYIKSNVEFSLESLNEIAEETPGKISAEQRESIVDALNDAALGAQRIAAITSDIRLLSHSETKKRRPQELLPIVMAAMNICNTEIQMKGSVSLDVANDIMVDVNESELCQLFVNLLLNALQAVEGTRLENKVSITSRLQDNRVEIDVVDNGCGMSAKELPRVFDAFYSAKPAGSGTGLGLPICQKIIRAHKGTIVLRSEVGLGTTVRVSLPLSKQVKVHAKPTLLSVPAQRKRILLIDDDPLVSRVLARMLGKEHEVVAVSSAIAALAYLRKEAASSDTVSFDAIVCDLMMPEMSGMEFFEHCQREFKDLTERTIFLTGGAFTEEAEAFLASVPNRRMYKPFDSKDLVACVRKMLKNVG